MLKNNDSSRLVLYCALFLLVACQTKEKIGFVQSFDSALDTSISTDAAVEILAEGFQWSEGPLWVAQEKMLLFSDVPKNTIHKWTETKGLETYLTPAGYTVPMEGSAGEGSNGLLLNSKGELVICQHGDRRMATMNAPLQQPIASFATMVDSYEGKRLNSPNDAVFHANGDLFFTDPPYGFANDDKDSLKELSFNGVYRWKETGEIHLLLDSLTRPNGIILLDDSTLLIANSDKNKARWYAYTLKGDSLTNGRIFYDATAEAQTEKGLPDGLKISRKGIIYATGPGGVWIFSKEGKVLGKIKTTVATANCALDDDEQYLYITASTYLLRVRLQP